MCAGSRKANEGAAALEDGCWGGISDVPGVPRQVPEGWTPEAVPGSATWHVPERGKAEEKAKFSEILALSCIFLSSQVQVPGQVPFFLCVAGVWKGRPRVAWNLPSYLGLAQKLVPGTGLFGTAWFQDNTVPRGWHSGLGLVRRGLVHVCA